MRKIIFFTLILFVTACGNRKTDKVEKFSLVVPKAPEVMTEDQKDAYVRLHFWDNFDFQNESIYAGSVSIREYFNAYAKLLAKNPTDSLSTARMMEKASANKMSMEFFSSLADTYFHDPNSPYRSDEHYIPVLKVLIDSPLSSDEDKTKYKEILAMVSTNRLGKKANDFRFISREGDRRLYSLDSEYILIYFNNPGCEMCKIVTEEMVNSAYLDMMVETERLTILAVYPDEDLEAWREYRGDFPDTWINSYNPDKEIENLRTYNLNAIPSLYLLDRDKRVVLKDETDVRKIEFTLSQH